MAISKDRLYEMVDRLNEEDIVSAYDYLQYLFERKKQDKALTWAEIDELEPDNEPLTDEEKRQLESPREYITLEQAKHEYEI